MELGYKTLYHQESYDTNQILKCEIKYKYCLTTVDCKTILFSFHSLCVLIKLVIDHVLMLESKFVNLNFHKLSITTDFKKIMKTTIVVDENSYTCAHFISLHNPTYTADYLYDFMKKYDILSENQRLSVKSKMIDLLVRLKQEISTAIDIIINKNVLTRNDDDNKYDIFNNS